MPLERLSKTLSPQGSLFTKQPKSQTKSKTAAVADVTRNWCQHSILNIITNINIPIINAITVLRNPLDRLSTIPGNYKVGRNNKNKTRKILVVQMNFLFVW